MGGSRRNGRNHNNSRHDPRSDPHPDLHSGSDGAQRNRPGSDLNTPMNATGVTPDGKEPSMGGSQGTRAEARDETGGSDRTGKSSRPLDSSGDKSRTW